MQQLCQDFHDESDALLLLLDGLNETMLKRSTLFKAWSISDVIGHLHVWNNAAALSLSDAEAFARFREAVLEHVTSGRKLREFDHHQLAGLQGLKLLDAWRDGYVALSKRFASIDPKQRMQWVGPEFSARSCVTARLMETWAHGQAVYDVLGATRTDSDRIRNIAQLGVNTFSWTFANRALEVPANPPYLRLSAPSGASWEWHEPSETCRIEGSASEFCQVVTQVRNIADTKLSVTGKIAQRWMAIAQCFAGPPANPPTPGTRRRLPATE
jgi:uncharacterized protein (TIGR03084 family)